MKLELWSTAASIATFVVIAVTAIAAIVQLRQIRRANQLAGMESTFGALVDPTVRDLISYVRHELQQRMTEESFRDGLLAVPIDRVAHPELYLCDIYSHIGGFVRNGLIDETIYLQTEWYNVKLYWGLLQEVIRLARKSRPFLFENFEWLAARAQRWSEKHPHGDYPAGERRMLA